MAGGGRFMHTAVMILARPKSLARRTLGRIAVAAGVGILAATVVTYLIVYDAQAKLRLEMLTQYVADRAQREEGRFLVAESNHRILREIFIQRLQAPPETPAANQAWFQARLDRTADGAVRSRRELTDPQRQASTWIRAGTEITDEVQRLVRMSHELCEQYFQAWREQVASLYVSSPMQFNTGIAPTLPEWVWEIPADFDQDAHEWGRLGSRDGNPERASRWTGLLFDASAPPGEERGAFVTLCTPVDVAGRHMLTLHHDIFFEALLEDVLRPDLPGVSHAVWREDGRLIAHPDLWSELVASDGQLDVRESANAPARRVFAALAGQPDRVVSGYDSESGVYYAASRLRGPDWWFVSMLPSRLVRTQAFQSAQWVLWIGLASLGFVLAALAMIFRRELAQPLAELTQAARQLASGQAGAALAVARPDELGTLAAAFNEMTRRVTERDAELRAEKSSLERRVQERTAELRDSEARLRTLLERSPIAIVTLDAESGQFVDGNEHALHLLGVDRETLLTVGPAALSPPRQPDGRPSDEAAREHIAQALAGPTVFEWRHREPSGREVPCEVHLARLPATGRQLLVALLLDVTTRKQAEAELLRTLARERELGQLKSEFVSMVSHEFRTPLGVIVSSADVLQRYLDRLTPAERGEALAAIQGAVKRMAGMMEDVLLLGRFDGEQQRFQPDDLHLVSFCRRLADEMYSAVAGRCPLELQLEETLPLARADENLLRHILGNLISNAVKYSPAGTPVTFRLMRSGAEAVFEIKDRGLGIPPADQPRLFASFHRGRNTGAIPGTGLGLVIVKRCVDLHGGRITFASEEDLGTTFTVKLPVFEP